MSESVQQVELSSICKFIDYRGKTPEKTTGGIPLITAKIVKDGRIKPYGEYIAESDYETWMRRGIPHQGDVIITTEAPLGEVAEVPSGKVAFAQRIIVLSPDRSRAAPRYIKYALQSPDVQNDLQSRSSGTVVTGIRSSELQKLTIPLPNLKKQEKIAQILGSLDDKIELNNQINETLELMAKAIFKEWFIDFGPVKAKAEGKKPFGMDDETASLFPDSFVDSEFGQIPKGWRAGLYKDLMCQTKSSVSPGRFQFETCFHYSLPNYDNGKFPFEEKIDGIKSNKFIVNSGSILFSKLNPRMPRVWLPLHESDQDVRCLGSTEFVVINPISPENRWLSYCLLKENSFLERMSQIATGTSNSHQRVKPESIFEQKFILPPKDILEEFNKRISPLFGLILNLQRESQSLKKCRELLLPKLIAGEISV